MKYLLVITMATIFASCGKNKSTVYVPNTENGFEASSDSETASVTTEYGSLEVTEGIFSSQSDIIPWSSWWYPNNRTTMFDLEGRELAPLEKYDEFVRKNFQVSSVAAYYDEKELYDPREVAWSGLCHAWAIASVLHPEPKDPIKKHKITFSATDQKALLLKSYENVSGLQIYGQRNDGLYGQDYNDIYPDQFHRLIQVFLFSKKQPFLMDYDPSYPVWTVPVYLARMDVKYESKNSAIVKTWLTMASPLVDANSFTGTKSVAKYYEYRLLGNWEGNVLKVSSGEWINDSRYDHPDYLIGYPENVKRGSLNKEIAISTIDLILAK